MKETVINIDRKKVGETDIPDDFFAAKTNLPLIYEAVKMQRSCMRQGDAATRNRALVSGTTAKMYRQKGTGRARHGDARANVFVGGGKSFGPHPRDYSYRLPRTARKGALREVFSMKKKEDKLLIVDRFPIEKIKTKNAVAMFKSLGVTNGLVLIDGVDEKLEKSVRNIPGIKLLRWEGANVYDIVKHEHLVVTLPAMNKLTEVIKP